MTACSVETVPPDTFHFPSCHVLAQKRVFKLVAVSQAKHR
jgi:hypothetical protein